MTSSPNTNSLFRRKLLIVRVDEGFYPILSSGTKPLKDEAQDHGELNKHINSIEDERGKVLWTRH